MIRILAAFLSICVAAMPTVAAEYSVVVGRGVSNSFLSDGPCHGAITCLDAWYVWVLDADRTVAGPKVSGRVKAITPQHTEATLKFVESVELFVLRAIEDPRLAGSSGAKYSIVSLSPRYSGDRYCLWFDPKVVGLKLEPSEIVVDSDGSFCFKAVALASNNRWSGP